MKNKLFFLLLVFTPILNAQVNKLQTKINDIAKYTTNEPLAQLLVSNFEEFEKEKYEDEEDEE